MTRPLRFLKKLEDTAGGCADPRITVLSSREQATSVMLT